MPMPNAIDTDRRRAVIGPSQGLGFHLRICPAAIHLNKPPTLAALPLRPAFFFHLSRKVENMNAETAMQKSRKLHELPLAEQRNLIEEAAGTYRTTYDDDMLDNSPVTQEVDA